MKFITRVWGAAASLAFIPAGALAQTDPAPPGLAGPQEIAFTSGWAFVIIPLLVGLGAILVSFLVLRGAMRARQEAKAAQTWPAVPATVTGGEIAMRRISRGSGKNRRRGSAYTPVVRYSYTVAGKTYEGDRVRFGNQETSFRGSAEKVVAKYPIGSQITIRHDPATPSIATIETVAGSSLGPMILAGFIGLVGVMVTLIGALALFSVLAGR